MSSIVPLETGTNLPATPAAQTTDDPTAVIRSRIQAAENYRRRFEIGWITDLAFVAGQHWLVADRYERTLRHISEVDPAYEGRDLYVADIITENRGAALGELQAGDERPELLLPGNGDSDEDEELLQQQINRAVGHGWDYEWGGDTKLLDVRRKCVDLGVSAIRCRFDPLGGPPIKDSQGQPLPLPVHQQTGKPITDLEQARSYVADTYAGGGQVEFRQVNEGRIRWETGSAFNILVPPGVPHEDDFPWEVWVRPVLLDDVKAEYGAAAANLVADGDITSVLGLGMRQQTQASPDGGWTGGEQAKLRDHVWLYTYYERPSRKFPQGRTVVLATAEKKLLKETPQLPYCTPDGEWRSGIHYFHWWRLTDRFYSRGLIEGLKDPQRMINRRKTQIAETIDRGQPYIVVDKNSKARKRQGFPVEVLEIEPTERQPMAVSGVPPGAWMWQEVEALREDAAHASTLSALKLGENPPNIGTYSQLALLQEQESSKRAAIRSEHQTTIARLVEDSVHDIRRYWPNEKQILIAGDDNRLQADLFSKSKIPDFYVVRAALGSAKPRTQAAQLTLVTDLWNAAVQTQAPLHSPDNWLSWLRESLLSGQPQELPGMDADQQADKAELENQMLRAGEPVHVAYYDNPGAHIPVHRKAEDDALLSGDVQTAAAVEQHIQDHMAMAQQVAQQQAQLEAPAQAQQAAEAAAAAQQQPPSSPGQ